MKTKVQPSMAPPALDNLKDLTRIIQAAEGFHPVVAALQNGRSASIDGAWGSSAALAASALGLHVRGTLLLVIAFPRDLDSWADDVRSFAGLRPVVFPAWDSLPTDNLAVDEVAGQRLRVLRQLDGPQPPRMVLATFQALMQPVPDRAQLAGQRRQLQVNATVDPDELAAWLLDHGFQRTDAVEVPGEFSRRGGIFDVYSLDAEAPFRLEFFGDEIESIRQFSAQTQRSLGKVELADLMGTAQIAQPSVFPLPRVRGRGE